jgi:hypothetical protein
LLNMNSKIRKRYANQLKRTTRRHWLMKTTQKRNKMCL